MEEFLKIRQLIKRKLQILDEAKKHWNAIKMNYAKSQYFKHYQTIFESLYAECSTESLLSLINYKFIIEINAILESKLKFLGTQIMD